MALAVAPMKALLISLVFLPVLASAEREKPWSPLPIDPLWKSELGLAVFLLNLLYAFMKKKKAEQNPWGEGATTLEWTVSSPPPFHTFEELPKVK